MSDGNKLVYRLKAACCGAQGIYQNGPKVPAKRLRTIALLCGFRRLKPVHQLFSGLQPNFSTVERFGKSACGLGFNAAQSHD